MDIETRLILNNLQTILAARSLQTGGQVQQYIDSEVLRLSDPYLPFQSGGLKQSICPLSLLWESHGRVFRFALG